MFPKADRIYSVST